ncbi:phosphorylase b kinase gamma catalytic testis liver isoform [Stylonychia lemnae]|uniref:Phosphorylase b kinase gamma catalytic testis liver isoform n=1 Tax=Stylonychia lemnae TaxID=5949 RepID=A0A078AVU8_STYLE|nr:phosphorylase b kinase gamma catalytic testis liver isoform [Stylonychia lemnae]|eukprot:CDW86555.1 phosphorylase b kinase gamma catalytic testis liver isoform [Stylonychia lemnae]
MKQLLQGLSTIHDAHILHRDLKLENILMEDPLFLKIKIIDFGLACKKNEINKLNQRCGTPGYVAPEILNNGFASKGIIYRKKHQRGDLEQYLRVTDCTTNQIEKFSKRSMLLTVI